MIAKKFLRVAEMASTVYETETCLAPRRHSSVVRDALCALIVLGSLGVVGHEAGADQKDRGFWDCFPGFPDRWSRGMKRLGTMEQ